MKYRRSWALQNGPVRLLPSRGPRFLALTPACPVSAGLLGTRLLTVLSVRASVYVSDSCPSACWSRVCLCREPSAPSAHFSTGLFMNGGHMNPLWCVRPAFPSGFSSVSLLTEVSALQKLVLEEICVLNCASHLAWKGLGWSEVPDPPLWRWATRSVI